MFEQLFFHKQKFVRITSPEEIHYIIRLITSNAERAWSLHSKVIELYSCVDSVDGAISYIRNIPKTKETKSKLVSLLRPKLLTREAVFCEKLLVELIDY